MGNAAFVLDNAHHQNDLIDECRQGSREAMHSLYLQHQRRVFSVAVNFFGGDKDKAADVTQQVFLKLFTGINFRGDSRFTTWLYRLTINTCIDEARKNRRWFGLDELFERKERASAPDPDRSMRSEKIVSEVQAALRSFKPIYRAPLVLKYIEGLSYQQIAEVLECSVGTVSSRLNRGLKMLAERLGHLRNEI